jgi:hypothetical protein
LKRLRTNGTQVLVYFCGDRPNLVAQVASDAVRWIYDHLLSMNQGKEVEQIDLYIYSRGGSLEAPWEIITTLRQMCKKLNVLIPYRAHSATTLIALGANRILMGHMGELGPIDPQMHSQMPTVPGSAPLPSSFSVEDIMSYIAFLKEKVGLTDQKALSELTKSLAENLTATTIGQINRTHSHIRLVARRMLAMVQPPIDNVRINQIVESLAEKIYVHGHSIGRTEAKQIGIQVEEMDEDLEKLCWDLFLEHESLMMLNSPTSPFGYFHAEEDEYNEDHAILACIESMNKYHELSGKVSFKVRRSFPQPVTLNINLNFPIQLPAGFNVQQLTPEGQQLLQQISQQLQRNFLQQARDLISQEIKRQSVIVGIDIRGEHLTWKEGSEP